LIFNVLLKGMLWIISLILALITNYNFGIFTVPSYFIYIIGIFTGPALCGTWVSQRQMIVELAPPSRTSNYFGIANIFGKVSAAIGPLIWLSSINLFSKLLGFNLMITTKYTLIILLLILLIGLWFILEVTDRHQDYLNGKRHIGNGEW